MVYDPDEQRINFSGAFLELFGARILPLPGLTIRTDGGAVSGFLVPDLRVFESNGVEVSGAIYRFADDKDLTLTTHVYTDAAPMVARNGGTSPKAAPTRSPAMPPHSQRVDASGGIADSTEEFRGYLFATASSS